MSEVGLNWAKVKLEDQGHIIARNNFQPTQTQMAHDTIENDISKTHQPGGTGIKAVDDECYRVIATGKEPKEMGQWCWIALQGKQNYTLRTLSAY